MARSEVKLLLHLFNYVNQTSKPLEDALGFLKAVRVAFQNNRKAYGEFLKVLRDFSAKRIYISGVKAKLKTLFKGHNYLILEFNSLMPKKHGITLSLEDSDASSFVSFEDLDTSSFVKAVKLALQYKRENNYGDFDKVMKGYMDQSIGLRCFSARVNVLLKNHPDLILEFNTFMPSQYRIKTTTGNKVEDNGKLSQLPSDVLDIICKTLDFVDLFSFSGVCKNWRTFHKSNFLWSQEPLLVRICMTPINSYSLISMPNQKVYDLKIMSCFQYPNTIHVRVSSGYFIMTHKNNSFVLFNPFTRNKMVINATFEVNHKGLGNYEALLAFEKCSEEFVLVVLCKKSSSLYVYQSRYYAWFTYSTLKPEVVVDFVVLNNIIYVVTNNAKIGVLNLNSRNIQFLNLENAPDKINPDIPFQKDPSQEESFMLVNCDEQLLVFDLRLWKKMEVYKIDFSNMNYVKMETLGDIALFYDDGRNIRALSNPKRFGYQSNYVYEVNCLRECVMYDWNRGCRSQTYPHGGSDESFNVFDWCFRHIKYGVDYSLVE